MNNAYRQECKKELYDLLPQEDQIALRRGRKLAKIEEKWKKKQKKKLCSGQQSLCWSEEFLRLD